MPYRLTAHAREDLDLLLYSIAERFGWDHSMDVEEGLFEVFDTIARLPGIGHLRSDLLPSQIYFYYAAPYMVLYLRDASPLLVIAVIHGARDIASVMQERLV